jgi:hypothetical protein
MNVLLAIGIGLVVLLAIIFFAGMAKYSAKACLVTFVALLVVACVAIVMLSLPPKMESWQVTYSNGNMITLFNGKTNLNLDISKVPRISTDYKVGTYVQLTKNALGTPLFLTPQDWTVIPK